MNSIKKWVHLPLLVAALVAWGCEPAGQLIGPGEPNFTSDPPKYRAVEGGPTSTDTVASAVIGESGGVLRVSGHRLTIPGGAVKQATTFTIRALQDGRVGVKMIATAVGSTVENDIGSKGFWKPLELRMDYTQVTESGLDSNKYLVGYDKKDGSYEAQKSWVDGQNRWLFGEVKHFSEYVIVFP